MMKLEGWVQCTKISAEFEFGGHSPMKFSVDNNHVSHCNLSDDSITFTRWRHIPSLLAQPAVTCTLQRVACRRPATTLGKSAQAV